MFMIKDQKHNRYQLYEQVRFGGKYRLRAECTSVEACQAAWRLISGKAAAL